jgi:hypothetical protein
MQRPAPVADEVVKTIKLASRISSIRRMAWKQCSSCSADPLSMWRDSFASNALAGWTRSSRASSTSVTGCWREPVDLGAGMQPAHLRRKSP